MCLTLLGRTMWWQMDSLGAMVCSILQKMGRHSSASRSAQSSLLTSGSFILRLWVIVVCMPQSA